MLMDFVMMESGKMMKKLKNKFNIYFGLKNKIIKFKIYEKKDI